MTNKAYDIDHIAQIADSIRAKNKSKSKYYLSEMPDQITRLIWHGGQEDYDELEVKDPNVLYLIDDRPPKETYIRSIAAEGDAAYIPVEGAGELCFEDTFIIDFIPSTAVNKTYMSTIIGGSKWSDQGYSFSDFYYRWGISVSYDYNGNSKIVGDMVTRTDTKSRELEVYEEYTAGTRQQISITVHANNDSWDAYRRNEVRTDGGFYIFGYRNYSTSPSEPWIYPHSTQCLSSDVSGKIFRITVIDKNNDTKFEFVPTIQNEHKGMLDLVSNTFYPCNDDTKFEIGKAR